MKPRLRHDRIAMLTKDTLVDDEERQGSEDMTGFNVVFKVLFIRSNQC